MKCMNCGAELTDSVYCPKCGCDISVQRQAIVLSGLYYNQGLEKAQIRDLSGAIDQLKRSLKFNKMNIPARNLLGLVYFETGEVVAALSEWVISKNIQPEGNIASDYIEDLRKDANRLDTINQTIKKYNLALDNCLSGNEDVAEIQLKKILAQNPKLIKGYHLLSLLYIRRKDYEEARKLLKKAARIDRTNTTTLRFLREVDEQTGINTPIETRQLFHLNYHNRTPETVPDVGGVASEDRRIIQPVTHVERSTGFTIMNIILGIVIGAACIWFLFMPAKISRISQAANEKVTQYSAQMATQSAELYDLQKAVANSQTNADNANNQAAAAQDATTACEYLLKAVYAVNKRDYTEAADAITRIDVSLLSQEAKAIYDDIYYQSSSALISQYKEEGIAAFNAQDYTTAIDRLEKAKALDVSDYDVLNYLAHAYRLSGNSAAADINFQTIIDTYPNTNRAENARVYMSTAAQMPSAGAAPAETPQTPQETPQETPEGTEPVQPQEGA